MRKSGVLLFLLTMVISAGSLSAEHYNLFVHGRSSKDHCSSITTINSAKADTNGYWSGWGYTPTGLPNIRYVGFDGERDGGAFSWSTCGAQKQFYDALNVFCRNGNSCAVFTHSTGGLVAAKFFSQNQSSVPLFNITKVTLMASAHGGSELADIAVSLLGWAASIGWGKNGGELDHSVSTAGARSFDHNRSGGLRLRLTSGEGKDPETFYVTWAFLPGTDDGVVANHSLCGINKVATVDASCAIGNGTMSESFGCGFLKLGKCTWYRYTPYYTVYRGGSSQTHKTSMGHYLK